LIRTNGRNGRNSFFGRWIVGVLGAFLLSAGLQTARAENVRSEVPWVRLMPEKPADLESGECLLEAYTYYMGYKKNAGDCAAVGGLARFDIGHGWEVRFFGDIPSWQQPSDIGLGDVAAGVKWNFLKGEYSAAAAFDLEFPSGTKEFREPGPEPTLSLILSRKFGSFEPSCTVSGTYASSEDGEKDYFSTLLTIGLDYTLNDVHSFGLFATGYTPANSTDHSSRISAGISYTFTLDECNSYSITFTKGFSERGMDWSIALSFDYSFNIHSLFRAKRPLPDRYGG
jgi:hypothetical protein